MLEIYVKFIRPSFLSSSSEKTLSISLRVKLKSREQMRWKDDYYLNRKCVAA